MDKSSVVHFHIKRKWSFAGSLLVYKLCINGEYIGALKNGKTLDVDIPKSDFYFIDEWPAPSGVENAMIRARDMEDPNRICLENRRGGGWKTAAYNAFFCYRHGEYSRLPSLDFPRYYQANFEKNLFSGLSQQEQVLAHCSKFFLDVAEAADDVLWDEKLFNMLRALEAIGAHTYIRAFASIMEIFKGIDLPLKDEMLDQKNISEKINMANQLVWDCEKKEHAGEEFHKCLVKYILRHFCA